jgi:hypothetical protein
MRARFKAKKRPEPAMRPFVFRQRYVNPRCSDCGEINHTPVCECGLIRARTDEHYITNKGQRLDLAPFYVWLLRDVIADPVVVVAEALDDATAIVLSFARI